MTVARMYCAVLRMLSCCPVFGQYFVNMICSNYLIEAFKESREDCARIEMIFTSRI